MARLVNLERGVRETLAKATADCSDKIVAAFVQCGTVLTLRAELATIERLERARYVVGTRLQETEIAVPTNAGEIRIARMTGLSVDEIEDAFLIIGIAVLAFLRLTSGARQRQGEASVGRTLPDLSDGRSAPLGSERPMTSLPVPDLDALRLDTEEMPAREGGKAATQSPELRVASGDAVGDTGRRHGDCPGWTVTEETPAGDSPARDAAPAEQGTPTAGVSPGSQGMPRAVPAVADARADGSVAAFYRERTHPSLGCRVRAQCLYEAYAAWCKAVAIAPASMTVFGRNRPSYVRRHKTNGLIVYHDIALGTSTASTTQPAASVPAIPAHRARQGATSADFGTASASVDALVGALAGT